MIIDPSASIDGPNANTAASVASLVAREIRPDDLGGLAHLGQSDHTGKAVTVVHLANRCYALVVDQLLDVGAVVELFDLSYWPGQ